MGAEDIWGKLQKIAKLEILRALVFGSNRLQKYLLSTCLLPTLS